MSDVAIQVENLGKRYRIGERERGIRHAEGCADPGAGGTATRVARWCDPAGASRRSGPCKDVSFEVRRAKCSPSSAAMGPARARC